MGQKPLTNSEKYHERTLCEVNREIYRELKKRGFKDGHPVIIKLFEAYDMAKKLNNKLRQYKHDYDNGWWEKNKLAGGTLDQDEKTPDMPEIEGAPI